MIVFGVTADNDEWPEDRLFMAVIVAAPDKETAIKTVKEYGEPLTHCNSNFEAEEIYGVAAEDDTKVITYFMS